MMHSTASRPLIQIWSQTDPRAEPQGMLLVDCCQADEIPFTTTLGALPFSQTLSQHTEWDSTHSWTTCPRGYWEGQYQKPWENPENPDCLWLSLIQSYQLFFFFLPHPLCVLTSLFCTFPEWAVLTPGHFADWIPFHPFSSNDLRLQDVSSNTEHLYCITQASWTVHPSWNNIRHTS